MLLKILSHPILIRLNYHMPALVDLSPPITLLTGDNGCGKSTLLQSIYFALRGDDVEGFVYRWDRPPNPAGVFLFDAEQHNPRMHLELFDSNPRMKEFVAMASHGQVMLAMFNETFPSLADGTILLLDEPEMALSTANQRRVLGLLKNMTVGKNFRVVCATHSPVFIDDPETAVINLDKHINRAVIDPAAASDTIQ